MSNQWYPFFPGDYARDTVHLSLMEDCYYRRLLDYYYSTGGPLPADLERLQRVCRAFTPEEKGAVQYVLTEFFPAGEDALLHNSKADEVIAKGKLVSEKRADAARQRHAKRLQNPANADPDDANAEKKDAKTVHPQPQPQPHIKPPPIKGDTPLIERLLREMVEEKREFIRTNYGLDDGEINIHLEEMVVKTRNSSPGPDLWLYVSRFLKNRKDDIHGKQQRIASGAAAPGRKEAGAQGAKAGGGGGLFGGPLQAGSPAAGFTDRSSEWESTAV